LIDCLRLNIYLYVHHVCFILSDLKCYGSAISSFINHLWSANEKITRRIINFPTFTKCDFFSSSFWTLPTFKPHNLLKILFILNNEKCYRSATWNSTNHFWTLMKQSNIQRKNLDIWRSTFVMFSGLFVCLFFFFFFFFFFFCSWPLLFWGP